MKYIIEPIAYAVVYIFQFAWFFNHRKAKAATDDWLWDNNLLQAVIIAVVITLGIIGIVQTFYHK